MSTTLEVTRRQVAGHEMDVVVATDGTHEIVVPFALEYADQGHDRMAEVTKNRAKALLAYEAEQQGATQ